MCLYKRHDKALWAALRFTKNINFLLPFQNHRRPLCLEFSSDVDLWFAMSLAREQARQTVGLVWSQEEPCRRQIRHQSWLCPNSKRVSLGIRCRKNVCEIACPAEPKFPPKFCRQGAARETIHDHDLSIRYTVPASTTTAGYPSAFYPRLLSILYAPDFFL